MLSMATVRAHRQVIFSRRDLNFAFNQSLTGDLFANGIVFLARALRLPIPDGCVAVCGRCHRPSDRHRRQIRAISREVSGLLKARNFLEAEALANKGLALCDDAVGVRGFCVGQFNDSLGDIAYARAQYPAALTFFQRAAEARDGIIDSENVLRFASQVRLGRTYIALRRTDEAEPLLKSGVAGLSRAAPLSPNLRTALESLRGLYAGSGRIDEEIGVLRSELVFHEKADGGNAQTLVRAKLLLNLALVKQAKSLSAKSSDADAERALFKSISLIDPPPAGAEKHLSVSLEELAIIYYRQRRFAEAEPLLLRPVGYRETLAEPSDADLPVVLSNLAALYQGWGKPEMSIQYGLRAIAKFDEAAILNSSLGIALSRLGHVQKAFGQTAEAQRSFARARDVFDHVAPEDNPERMNVDSNLGALQFAEENYADAERSFRSALELEQKYPNPDTYRRSEALAWLGAVYREKARYDEAERLLLEAVKLEETVGGTRKSLLGPRLTQLGTIYRRENRYADAETALSRALNLEQSALDRATALNSLGLIYNITARHDLAEPLLKEALDIRSRALPANSDLILETLINLAAIDKSRGNLTEAEAKLRHTLELAETLGPRQSTVVRSIRRYSPKF